ncbi:hypothetical protein [Listeria goaensis]|uniref:hypothetical protein n=1 Tax=Listeria goaensis TaxID=1649188 RepID=UPI001967D18B|nr:hypothetical protein [Listeria goaensis]
MVEKIKIFLRYATNRPFQVRYGVKDKEDAKMLKKELTIKIDYLSIIFDTLKLTS